MTVYVVQSGDTLTKIAEEIYGDAELWRLIYQENRKTLKSPDKIQVGQKLQIPDADTELVDEPTSDDDADDNARTTLRVGATDRRAVKALQALLVAGGYDVAIDGSFGAGTKAAVLDVQTSADLSADGVVGPGTWAALDALAQADGEEGDEEEDDEEDDDDDDDEVDEEDEEEAE